jgi:hypothetical protein
MSTRHGGSRRAATVGALLLQLAAMAQDSARPRRPHPGRVLDERGQPLAGAHVVLASQGRDDAFRNHPRHDVVRVTTRADGRFTAAIDPQLDYLAWAVAGDQPGSVVGRAVEVGMQPVELQITPHDRPPLAAIEVRGLAPWRALGRMRLRAVPLDCGMPVSEGPLDDTDQLPLPPLPPVARCLLLFFLGDRLVHDAIAMASSPVSLPPPRRVPVRVTGADGKPNGNAALDRVVIPSQANHSMRIWPMRAGRFYAASTANDGTAELVVGAAQDPRTHPLSTPIVFLASSPGHVETSLGLHSTPFVAGEPITGRAALAPLEIQVRAAPADARPLRIKADPAVAVRALGTLQVRTGPSSVQVRLAWELSREGDRASTAHLPAEFTPQSIELDQHLLRLEPSDRFARAPVVAVPTLPMAALQESRPFRPEQLQPVRLQVMAGGAGPAPRALVFAMPAANGAADELTHAMRTYTDQAGRLVLPAVPGRLLVIALTDHAWGQTWVAPDDDRPHVLTLEPMARVDLRVVGADGAGAPGATFRVVSQLSACGGQPGEAALTDLAKAIAFSNLDRLRSDAEGRAPLLLLPNPRVMLTLEASVGSRSTTSARITSAGGRHDLRLQ